MLRAADLQVVYKIAISLHRDGEHASVGTSSTPSLAEV